MTKELSVAVVGAGPAGLTAAHELKYQGHRVDLFESHSKPGGSASYFKRKPYSINEYTPLLNAPTAHQDLDIALTFDAGATVLWAMEEGGLLARKLKEWQILPGPFEKTPMHYFTIQEAAHPRALNFKLDSTSPTNWTHSLALAFPQDANFIHRNFPAFFDCAKSLSNILYRIPAEPFLRPRALMHNLLLIPEAWPAIQTWASYPRSFSKMIAPLSAPFKKWIEGQTLISLQSTPQNVETLYGLMALCFFPLGCGTLQGGMMSLFSKLLQGFDSERCKSYLKTKIIRLSKDSHGYHLHTESQKHGPYSHVLFSTPRWNTEDILGSKLPNTPPWEQIQDQLWSANVAYMVFRDKDSFPRHAFNHMLCTKNNETFYFSVGSADDTLRGNGAGLRVVTASTHEKLGRWNFPHYKKKETFEGQDLYKAQKMQTAKAFLMQTRVIFKEDPIFLEVGTPKTFCHYTQRKEGFVGGIPLSKDYSFFKSPTQETPLPNVYQIGDTAFPGQSVVNCLVGSLEAVRKVHSPSV